MEEILKIKILVNKSMSNSRIKNGSNHSKLTEQPDENARKMIDQLLSKPISRENNNIAVCDLNSNSDDR